MRLDRGMDAITGPLITAFDYVWDRLTGRLSGLTDEEYFWEPVAGCWSLRQGGDGRWHLDGAGWRPRPRPGAGDHHRLAAWPPGRNSGRRLCEPAVRRWHTHHGADRLPVLRRRRP